MNRWAIIVVFMLLVLLLCAEILINRQLPDVFFDDFCYEDALQLFAKNTWSGRDLPYAAWSIKDNTQGYELFGDANGIASLTRPAKDMIDTVDFESKARFQYGTYAARIRFADTPHVAMPPEAIVQYFCAISPKPVLESDRYAEFDFEYLDHNVWRAPGRSVLYAVSWYKRSNQHPQWYNGGTVGGKWLVLVLRVYDEENARLNETAADYEIWDTSAANPSLLDGPDWNKPVPLKYVAQGKMKIAFGIWWDKKQRPLAASAIDHSMNIDWVFFENKSFLSYNKVIERIGRIRGYGYARLDTLGDVQRANINLRGILLIDVIISFFLILFLSRRQNDPRN